LATKKRNGLDHVKELIGKRLEIQIDDSIPKEKIMKCPDCGHALVFIAELPRRRGPPGSFFTISAFKKSQM
jgi:hypothetical protein